MPRNESNLSKFVVGSLVRVRKGVVSPQHSDLPLGGWRGKVYEVSGAVCFVHWSVDTLEVARTIHRTGQQSDGRDFRAMWLQKDLLEIDPAEPLQIELEKKVS
jgi:hypothetical protein